MEKERIGQTQTGEAIHAYTLRGGTGGKLTESIVVTVMDFGATVLTVQAAGAHDALRRDVVLGYDRIADYFKVEPYFGATVGPNANRIGGAAFTLNGTKYRLTPNHGANNNHSGGMGWNQRLWSVRESGTTPDGGERITLGMTTPEDDCGFPGGLDTSVTYTVNGTALVIDYRATASRDTLYNPINHSYYNLKGHGVGTIEEHELTVYADAFLPGGEMSLPDGTVREVADTPFDFRTLHAIGERIRVGYDELTYGKGYDHCFVLNGTRDESCARYDSGKMKLHRAATLADPEGTLFLDVFTTQPGLMVYTGNYLSDSMVGKGGCLYRERGGVALEAQYFPNAIHVDGWDAPIIHAGETKQYRTVYAFRAE